MPELAPPREPITLKLEGGVSHLALSPDGKLIALAWNKLAENGLNVYQWPDLAIKQQWKVEVGGARGLGFAADNKTIYAVDKDFFAGVSATLADSWRSAPLRPAKIRFFRVRF